MLEPAWVTVVCKTGCATQVIQESGWRGLFNGLQASLLGTAVSQGVYFYFYSVLRQLAIARHQRLTRSPSQARREYLQVGQGVYSILQLTLEHASHNRGITDTCD